MKRRPRDRVFRGRRTPATHAEPASGLSDLVTYLARGLVDDPGSVQVAELRREGGSLLELRVAPADLGNVIGRSGRTAKAIRTLLAIEAAHEGREADLDILD